MPLVEINWRPETKVLRQFGAVAAVALPVSAWWTTGNPRLIAFAAIVGALAATLAWVRPTAMRMPFVALSVATAPIGMVLSELLVALMFFGVFLPIGLVFRLLGRNPLQWQFKPEATTYWERKRYGRTPDRYLRQY